MTRGTPGGTPLGSRALLLPLALLGAAMLALLAGPALAAGATQDWVGAPGGPTPDLERQDLRYFGPDGTDITAAPGRSGPGAAGTINTEIDGTHRVTYCADVTRGLAEDPVEVEVQEIPLSDTDRRAQAWIHLNATPTGPAGEPQNTEAAVSQVAIWSLLGLVHESAPTDDAAVNAAVAELLARARAESATPATLSLSGSDPEPGAKSARITLAARPGAEVTLAVASGAGTLAESTLTAGPEGTASTTLTASGPGRVVVRARTAGDGRLFRVSPTGKSQATQYAEPSALARTLALTFAQAPPPPAPPSPPAPPPPGPPAPPVVPGGEPEPEITCEGLREAGAGIRWLRKFDCVSGPRAVRVGVSKALPARTRNGRDYLMRVVVRNRSAEPVEVKLIDVLPAGMVGYRKDGRIGARVLGRVVRMAPGGRYVQRWRFRMTPVALNRHITNCVIARVGTQDVNRSCARTFDP